MNSNNDIVLEKIIDEIKSKYHCHTIILYGSRARGEQNKSSDYDVIAIRDEGEFERDCRIFDGFYLDAFIYPKKMLDNPENYLIRARDGIIIFQKDQIGDNFLRKINLIYESGPPAIPAWERHEIPSWLNKMLQRAKENDIEGNFRMHWLLHDALECYFKMRNLWYLGPKESFKWLNKYDNATYYAFEEALKQNANFEKVEYLINCVIEQQSNER